MIRRSRLPHITSTETHSSEGLEICIFSSPDGFLFWFFVTIVCDSCLWIRTAECDVGIFSQRMIMRPISLLFVGVLSIWFRFVFNKLSSLILYEYWLTPRFLPHIRCGKVEIFQFSVIENSIELFLHIYSSTALASMVWFLIFVSCSVEWLCFIWISRAVIANHDCLLFSFLLL